VPFYVQELIDLKEACKYKLRSDCDGLLLNPVKFKTLTMLGDRYFAVAAPQLWNSLPKAIGSSPSVAHFKDTRDSFISESFLVILSVCF